MFEFDNKNPIVEKDKITISLILLYITKNSSWLTINSYYIP